MLKPILIHKSFPLLKNQPQYSPHYCDMMLQSHLDIHPSSYFVVMALCKSTLAQADSIMDWLTLIIKTQVSSQLDTSQAPKLFK